MNNQPWWRGPMRVIQDNLQVADTALMDPETIARETQQMSANVLVVNVGGIYAWYPSKVRYHHVNEYLPKDTDLLRGLIEACHQRGIKVVARFDFSKTDDYVCQERPEWFVREPDGSARSYGSLRPGNWSILYATCINGGYRAEGVAIPVLEEVLGNYPIDGIFLNAPNYEYCCCEACQKKYFELYGKPLPMEGSGENRQSTFGHKEAVAGMEPGFSGICYKDNISKLYQAIKRKSPDVPLILYYGIYNENLDDRLATCDLLCTEAQNVLSRGWRDIPPFWLPTIIMKMGRAQPEGNPPPFGIIHSCPGMDWRHTGMPQAEYRFWLRQIPAAGGTIWHSITGFNQTVSDKRILAAVGDVNAEIAKVEPDMLGAIECSDALLLWDSQRTDGWAALMVATQTQFDIRNPHQLTGELLARYPLVVLPDGYPLTGETIALLSAYVQEGGALVVEGTTQAQLAPFADVLGIEDSVRSSEPLTAAYWQFEPAGECLRGGLEDVPMLGHRGVTAYARALEGTQVLATLVPPFAPLNAVGSPPERASILVKRTDIPLCTLRRFGRGSAVMLPFSLAKLADQYHLAEHRRLWANLRDMLLNHRPVLDMEPVEGVVASVFSKGDCMLLHLVNGVGQRPLVSALPLADLSLRLRLPEGRHVQAVEGALEGEAIEWRAEAGYVALKLGKLRLWEMIRVRLG